MQPLTPTSYSLLSCHHPAPVSHLLPSMNLRRHVIITQSPFFTLGFLISVELCMDFDKCTMACAHHHSTMQNSFTGLKLLCAHLCLPPNSCSLCSLCSFPFPECQTFGLIQCIDFSVWRLSLSNIYLTFFHAFS